MSYSPQPKAELPWQTINDRCLIEDLAQCWAGGLLYAGAALASVNAAFVDPTSLIPHPVITFGIATAGCVGKCVDMFIVKRRPMIPVKAMAIQNDFLSAAATIVTSLVPLVPFLCRAVDGKSYEQPRPRK